MRRTPGSCLERLQDVIRRLGNQRVMEVALAGLREELGRPSQ
jgi:hypothetical protein